MSGNSVTYAAICIPDFPIASWLYKEPELSMRPLVLLKGIPPQQTVASMNRAAQASGIEYGMSKVQAEAMCAACFRSLDSKEEISSFSIVLELAARFSPRVQAVSTPLNSYAGHATPAAAVLLDITGTSLLFGSSQSFAQQLHEDLWTLGFESAVAIAPNAEAALMLSRYRQGVTFVEHSNLQERLAELPTALLTCDPDIHTLLHRWGINTLGQLAALPRTELVSRLGQQGLHLQQLASGEAARLFVPEQPPFTLTESLELDTPLNDLERLLSVLSCVLGAIFHKALTHALAIRCLTVHFALPSAHTHVVRVPIVHPTQSRKHLLTLLKIELQAHPPQAEVVALSVEASATKPEIAQRGLFQTQFPHCDQLDLLLARLRNIAGEHNVGSVALISSYREDAFYLQLFSPVFGDVESPARSPRPALRMLRPAHAITVLPYNELPQTLIWKGKTFNVIQAWGPWHSSGSWWNETSFEYNYWDIVTEPAHILRVHHIRASDQWSLVGLYD